MIEHEPALQERAWAQGLDRFGIDPADPVCELADLMVEILRSNRSEVSRFQLACDALKLPPADGLGMALLLSEQPHEVQLDSPCPEVASSTVGPGAGSLSNEQMFVICRDVLGSPGAEKAWRDRMMTHADLLRAIRSVTRKLELGDDPREPW